MADGLVSALVVTVLGILKSVAVQEIGLLWGLKDELNSLESIFVTIQLVLQDAEIKQGKNDLIENWLRKLKNVACDAENILDSIATEGLRRRVDSQRGMQHQLKSFLSLRNPLLFRLKMVRKVRNIRVKLDAIAKERLELHLGEGVIQNRFGETLESRLTCSLVNESDIFGRNEEKEMIIKKLFDDMSDRDDLSVYAICGMGGLGKTTLAQMVYNDGRTERHFELRIWVCVSDDFSIRRLIRAMIESIQGKECNICELDPLQRLLQESLRGRRFLLVLDDVWNENHRLWDELKQVLRCGSKGSIVMVTTRIEKVAFMMATNNTHHIGYLSEDDSWSLFKQRAFANGKGEDFVAIGKEIVKKCGGVPLAIKALGSLMRSKSRESEWLAIKESEIWHLSDDENGILPALRLSYDNLLPQMRQCFAYCCIFPKDYLMEEEQLIQLWMANGYLPSDGQTDLYLTGQLIFKELVWRSFLQDVEINDWRNYTACKMHDLMHDLALFVMRHETYILEHGKVLKIPKPLRHLSIDSRSYWDVPDNKRKLKLPIDDSLRSIIVHVDGNPFPEEGFSSLRSIIVHVDGNPICGEAFSSLLSKQKHLRALDMNYCIIEKLPNLVCKLEHLRFLAMRCYNIKRLPESLTHLHNLQTLKLIDSRQLLELPKGLKVMKNLWFLEIKNFRSLICTPPGLGDLTCLRSLSIFIVGQDASHKIHQLKELNLGGELSIQGLDNVRNSEDAKSANLMKKSNLTCLRLSWTKGIKMNSARHFEEVLNGLQPHQNLETIRIKQYQGSRFPNWMSTLAFEKLKEVSLEDCPRCEHLPPLGRLPSLTRLTLCRMNSIKCLEDGEKKYSFPALTNLRIISMPNFEEWTIKEDSVESFRCLKDLTIQECPKLTGVPKLPTLRSLFISGCSAALVRSITFLTSLASLALFSFADLDVFPGELLQNHKALEMLQIGSLPIRTLLLNMLDNLTALKYLSLDGCSNLESLSEGLVHLNSLESLNINWCNGLTSFPATILESLSSLTFLSFQDCEKLKPLLGPLRRATALHDLLMNGLPELKQLPESMQQLSDLRELRIWHCEGLWSLPNWLRNLQSLSVIKIWYCKNLNCLPDDFNSLKSLRELDICGCPELEKRCKKPNGEDWPKISHIPIIRINDKAIQNLDILSN